MIVLPFLVGLVNLGNIVEEGVVEYAIKQSLSTAAGRTELDTVEKKQGARQELIY